MAAAMLCSTWSREHSVDPIGTAGQYSGFLLVEWPLPWPHDVGDIPQLGGVARACAQNGIRLQAVVPGEGPPRVALWKWHPEEGSYRGREVPTGRNASGAGRDIAAAAMALLAAEGEGASEGPDGSEPVTTTEVLVCGHGKRDRCCGSLGTALAVELLASGTGPAVRVRRTSHTGGHRFAPTAIVLPEGTCWGYLDTDVLGRIAGRTGPVEEVIDCYRGCFGIGSPSGQALEREVLRILGWDLLDRPRSIADADDGRVAIEVRMPAGGTRRWSARVVAGRSLPVPECGTDRLQEGKRQTEWVVEDLVEDD